MGVQRRFPPYVLNVPLAVVIAVAGPLSVLNAPPGRTALDPLGYLLLVVGGLALGPRARTPLIVVWVTSACAYVYLGRGYPGVAAAFPVMVALYTAVRAGHRKIALVPLLSLAGVLVHDFLHTHGTNLQMVFQDRFLLVGWLVASAMMGGALRQWEAYVREAEKRAADAERTREETARRRAIEERLRIARELHDSLTHSISIVKVQAGVAIHLARKRGEQVPEALLAVQEAGSEAMRELRATLEVLRETTDEPTGHGLAQLPELLARSRSAGLAATMEISGAPRPLPAAIERAAYRIVQEALTNVARHAGPAATASVRVEYDDEVLVLKIHDDGLSTPAAPPAPGIGLAGMRERVTALGGRLETGPKPDGGFAVQAVLPLEPATRPAIR